MDITHHLLKRQIQQYLGEHSAISTEMERLLTSIEEIYRQHGSDNNTSESEYPICVQETDAEISAMKSVYECLIQRNPLGIFTFDCECRYTLWNPTMKRFTNVSDQQALGKYAFDVFPDFKKDGLDLLFYQALSGITTPPLEREFPYLDTGERPFANVDKGDQGFCEMYLTPLFSEDGTIIGGLGVLRDICERKRVKMAVQRQREYVQILQEMALRLSSQEELEGFFKNMLQRACQLLETPHAFMNLTEVGSFRLGKHFATGIFKDIMDQSFSCNEKLTIRVRELREPVLINNHEDLVNQELAQLSCWIAVPIFQENKPVGVIGVAYTQQGKGVGALETALLQQFAQLASVGLVQEALHEANIRLATLATIDPLTNLPNHRTIISHIEEMFAQSHNTQKEWAILFLDIDEFKSINDTWGHQAGDEVLREVGRRLKGNVRKEDFVGRYGGEEFAVVLPAIDLKVALQMAERLRQVLQATPCLWNAEQREPSLAISFTASIGVAVYPHHGMTRKELIEAADLAMYEAKHRGRNRVCVAGERENSVHIEVEQHLHETTNAGESVLNALAAVANAHDRGTSEHTYRTVNMAKATAEILGCPQDVTFLISQAALFHDIGKVGVPDTILHKEASLTEEEWAIMRRHPHIGSQILTEAGGIYSLLAHIVVAHHERWDGMGYPNRIQEDDIPLGARILSVVDSYDAMTSDRPYRKALSKEVARGELLRCASSQFDPQVVHAFLQVLDEQQNSIDPVLTTQK